MLFALLAFAVGPTHPIDPLTVSRFEKGYRYHQAGWIVVHVEGEPYERGVQHGQLLAPEIEAKLRCYAAHLGHKAPAESWKLARTLASSLYLRGHDREYLEEMKGIADGASAAGARLFGRRIDLLDVVTLNAWPEEMTLDRALNALPTGLEGRRFPVPTESPRLSHCSAFAATGPATKDGKIVFGHITMFSLYPSNFYNVWLDIKPTRGNRVVMQSFPGGIHSGMDYYLNDKGLMIAETTIGQTRFNAKGVPLASRIRRAMQYADDIDMAVAILKKDNNGLYTNEWLLGDAKTDQIAMFELGTHKTRLWRSSKDEWFGDTKGFYWGCNNSKDLEVRLETLASLKDRPATATFVPSVRDRKWVELYKAYNGKMDEAFGKLAFTTPPLAAYRSVDAKFTTTAMAKKLETWALFGPPLGRTWTPTFDERVKFPEIRPLVSNPWTILTGDAPAEVLPPANVADRGFPKHAKEKEAYDDTPAWRGTLLPGKGPDAWLALSFAAHERMVSQGRGLTKEQIACQRHEYRGRHAMAEDVPLSKITMSEREYGWADVAAGKGVLLLDALRAKLGAEKYAAMMDEFGVAHGGKPADAAAFVAHAGKGLKDADRFFKQWLDGTGIPGATNCPFHVLSPLHDLENALIVYGTLDDQAATKEAAFLLQEALRRRGPNVTVEVTSDEAATKELTDGRSLFLVGRTSVNRVTRRLEKEFTGGFRPASYSADGQTWSHLETAVLVAGRNGRKPFVVIGGLSAAATRRAALAFADGLPTGEVVILRPGVAARGFVVNGSR